MQCDEILKIIFGENFEPTGKVRILIRTEIRILPVTTSADPHIRILPPAAAELSRHLSRHILVNPRPPPRFSLQLHLSVLKTINQNLQQ